MEPNRLYDREYRVAQPVDSFRLQGVMTQVYAWMMAGLLVTGAIAMFVSNTAPIRAFVLNNPFVFFGLLIGELILVWILAAKIFSMSANLATGMFLFYSALNGLTLSVIFIMYTPVSIASTFLVTAGTFGAMSLYGYMTKRDLSGIGNFLIMALIGFLIASVVNLFFHNEMLYWVITYAGILIFVGLTAWDTQRIKQMAMQLQSSDETMVRRVAIIGALKLYLDFVNLFLLLLRILGNRR
jgi:hypothetical protein